MTIKFLPDVGICKKARNQKIFDISGCKLQTKIPKIPIFENATSSHANLTKFCMVIHIDVRKKSWKSQIDMLKIYYVTEQAVKCL